MILDAKYQILGCFRVNDIMFLLISEPIKHLNRLDRSYIFTESIAFWCMISKKCHNHSVWRLRRCIIEEIWKIHWKSTIKTHQYCFANISVAKASIFKKFYMVVNCYLVSLCVKLQFLFFWSVMEKLEVTHSSKIRKY